MAITGPLGYTGHGGGCRCCSSYRRMAEPTKINHYGLKDTSVMMGEPWYTYPLGIYFAPLPAGGSGILSPSNYRVHGKNIQTKVGNKTVHRGLQGSTRLVRPGDPWK